MPESTQWTGRYARQLETLAELPLGRDVYKMHASDLPIDSLLPEICETLRAHRRLVLAAPPGAGKTTRVPLALAGLIEQFTPYPGKIIILEPRRIAARMAAERMASSIGETLGKRIGLTTRVDRRVSATTQVEVVTDGVFVRRLLADPQLDGVSVVILTKFTSGA